MVSHVLAWALTLPTAVVCVVNSEAIQDFVQQLCAVSIQELQTVGSHGSQSTFQPRIFSLQKVVEVADANMNCRPRAVWTRAWRTLSKFFTTVGCHSNDGIAMYAIDSLKQLSMKFLEKDELRSFQFQHMFLQPFDVIIRETPSAEIRDLVLRVVDNMIQLRSHNIKSGWKTVFSVQATAAKSNDHAMVEFAFATVNRLLVENSNLITTNFVDLVTCLAAFAHSNFAHVATTALGHLQDAGNMLATGKVPVQQDRPPVLMRASSNGTMPGTPVPDGGMDESKSAALQVDAAAAVPEPGTFTDCIAHTALWWPLLTSLAALVEDQRLVIRSTALDVLFGLLQTHGTRFSPELWELVFRGVLFPLFDDVRHVPSTSTSHPAAGAGAGSGGAVAGAGSAAASAEGAPTERTLSGRSLSASLNEEDMEVMFRAAREKHDSHAASASRDGHSVGERDHDGGLIGPDGRVYRSGVVGLDDQSWLDTTAMTALASLIRLFSQYFDAVAFLLSDVLELLESCINQGTSGRGRALFECLPSVYLPGTHLRAYVCVRPASREPRPGTHRRCLHAEAAARSRDFLHPRPVDPGVRLTAAAVQRVDTPQADRLPGAAVLQPGAGAGATGSAAPRTSPLRHGPFPRRCALR